MLVVDYLIRPIQAMIAMSKLTTATALWMLAWALISPAQAQIYTWKDASGRVHFSDKAPANQQAERIGRTKPLFAEILS